VIRGLEWARILLRLLSVDNIPVNSLSKCFYQQLLRECVWKRTKRRKTVQDKYFLEWTVYKLLTPACSASEMVAIHDYVFGVCRSRLNWIRNFKRDQTNHVWLSLSHVTVSGQTFVKMIDRDTITSRSSFVNDTCLIGNPQLVGSITTTLLTHFFR
jgi:hypothetical protein